MSILIKGMKMPTDCTKCRFCDDETLFCWATREFISGFGHPKFCPLEEVPELATDCISRQAVLNLFPTHDWKHLYDEVKGLPSAQPEPCKDAVSRNAIIRVLNSMDRYVSSELTFCDTDKKFPKNEVFVVDDVYEEIVEKLPLVRSEPDWNEIMVICDNCGHAINVKRENCKVSAQPEPDIIACADCKHWINHDRRCGFWNHGVRAIDWCSRAERREDEKND